jgi:hypothetical protein
MDELATAALANHDAFQRFRSLARNRDPRRALALLGRLDDEETAQAMQSIESKDIPRV